MNIHVESTHVHEWILIFIVRLIENLSPSLPLSMDSSRCMALQKLWDYVCSIVANSVLKWSVVITRFGKPSTSEIRSELVDDDDQARVYQPNVQFQHSVSCRGLEFKHSLSCTGLEFKHSLSCI